MYLILYHKSPPDTPIHPLSSNQLVCPELPLSAIYGKNQPQNGKGGTALINGPPTAMIKVLDKILTPRCPQYSWGGSN